MDANTGTVTKGTVTNGTSGTSQAASLLIHVHIRAASKPHAPITGTTHITGSTAHLRAPTTQRDGDPAPITPRITTSPTARLVAWHPASRTQIDLDHTPYVLYGVKYIDLVSLAAFFRLRWPVEHNYLKSKCREIWIRDVFCYRAPAPNHRRMCFATGPQHQTTDACGLLSGPSTIMGPNQNTSPYAQRCDLS